MSSTDVAVDGVPENPPAPDVNPKKRKYKTKATTETVGNNEQIATLFANIGQQFSAKCNLPLKDCLQIIAGSVASMSQQTPSGGGATPAAKKKTGFVSGYTLFIQECHANSKASGQDQPAETFKDRSSRFVSAWRALDESAKKPYNDRAAELNAKAKAAARAGVPVETTSTTSDATTDDTSSSTASQAADDPATASTSSTTTSTSEPVSKKPSAKKRKTVATTPNPATTDSTQTKAPVQTPAPTTTSLPKISAVKKKGHLVVKIGSDVSNLVLAGDKPPNSRIVKGGIYNDEFTVALTASDVELAKKCGFSFSDDVQKHLIENANANTVASE